MGISRARYHAELVMDDKKAQGEHLESATGERFAALKVLVPVGKDHVIVSDIGIPDSGPTAPEVIGREVQEMSTAKEMELDAGL